MYLKDGFSHLSNGVKDGVRSVVAGIGIFDYIEVFYNSVKPCQYLGGFSSEIFETQMTIQGHVSGNIRIKPQIVTLN